MFVWLIPVITFLTFCNEQLLSLARNNNEPVTFLKANVSKSILEIGLSFVLVVIFSWRWQGRVTGILVAYVLVGMYAFYYFIKRGYLFGSIKKKYIIDELVYAVPIIAMQASIFSMSASDKFFLSNFTGDKNETVGIYSVGCIFASIVFLFSSALIQYIFPKLYTLLAAPVVNYHSVKKYFLIYISVMAGGTLGVMVITPLLYHYFINAKYHPALKYTYILCAGYFLWSVSYFFYSYLLYHKLKRKILGLSFCCIVISLGCNYFFIKKWHEEGAALSVLTCYLIVLILTLIFTKEYWQKFIFQLNGAVKN
jgi:O-antigen/teichoic acid export membrane protein